MNYQSEYNFYYDKIYSKIERGVKGYYILQNNKKRSFGITHNEIRIFLSNDLAKDFFLNLNEELKQLLEIFNNRFTYYKENQINFIFENEIKAAFDKLNKDDFPKNYSLKKLIFEIAFTKAKMEISRLLHNNSNIFELFYDLGKFENFEIKEYSPNYTLRKRR